MSLRRVFKWSLVLAAVMITTSTSFYVSAEGRKKEPAIEFNQLPVEFRGGSKLLQAQVPSTSATGTMYVSLDAGHGYLFGSNMQNGQYTGADYGNTIPREDELNRIVTQRVYSVLDANTNIFPAVSRWVQQNIYSTSDWDMYGPTESGIRRVDRAWYDNPPYTDNPNRNYTTSDNEISSLYDRARHAIAVGEGTHTYGKILVSIHFNSSSGQNGPSIHLQSPNAGSTQAQYNISKRLGLAICDRIWETRFGNTSQCDRRIQNRDLAVLRETTNTLKSGQPFPVVLIEVADPTSTGDKTWLGTGPTLTDRLNSLGDAIATGILDFFNSN